LKTWKEGKKKQKSSKVKAESSKLKGERSKLKVYPPVFVVGLSRNDAGLNQ